MLTRERPRAPIAASGLSVPPLPLHILKGYNHRLRRNPGYCSGGGDVLPDGQVGEISFDLESARFGRVTLMVEMDRALDPVGIDPLSAIGIVFEANGLTDLIQLPLGAGSSKI